MQVRKWISEEALQISEEIREVKGKGEKKAKVIQDSMKPWG